jgi:hypothetical protein
MTQEELSIIAEKIKAGTATAEETVKFHEELNKLLTEMKGLLEE